MIRVANLSFTYAVFGFDYSALLLVLVIELTACFNILFGFIAVARYDSINRFIMPSILAATLFALPLVDYLGFWQSPLMYLHPIQPVLLLFKGVFQLIAAWQMIYGVLYAVLWIGLLFKISQYIFYRFIILKQA